MKLYIMNKLPTPYTDDLFRRLDADSDVDLQVYHLWKGSWRRPWKTELATGYPNRFMKVRCGADWEFLRRAWREKEAFFIIADWGHLPSVAIVVARLLRRNQVAIWTDTPQETIRRPWWKRTIRSVLLRWMLPKVSLIFAPGQLAHDLLVGMGVSSERIVNLPFLVDIDYPAKQQANSVLQTEAKKLRRLVGCEDKGLVFSMISTIYTSVKGQDVGLKAFAQAAQESPIPIGLLLAGDGPDRQKMEQLADDLGISDRVAFLGWREPQEMDAVYAATDVVLHPSRRDAYPLVVIEAMSWSKPVIGSDICGSVKDRVENGYNGYSFPSEDVQALSAMILSLAKDPEGAGAMGKNARITAEKWPLQRGVEIIRDSSRQAMTIA